MQKISPKVQCHAEISVNIWVTSAILKIIYNIIGALINLGYTEYAIYHTSSLLYYHEPLSLNIPMSLNPL